MTLIWKPPKKMRVLHITRFQNRRFSFLKPPIRGKETTYSHISTALRAAPIDLFFENLMSGEMLPHV